MDSRAGLIAFESRDAMACRIADVIEAQLGRAIAERGRARLALSGGSTPAGLYAALSRRPIEWSRVTGALVDERWVRPGAPGSNESFVRDSLVRREAAGLDLIGLWSPAPSPAEGLTEAEKRLDALDGPFDAVVLGMGEDGHTASWFPHAEGLAAALSESGPRLAAVRAQPSRVAGEHLSRMTMTLGAVASAGFLCLLIAGEAKRAAFERANDDGPVEDAPARAILRRRPDLWVAWAP